MSACSLAGRRRGRPGRPRGPMIAGTASTSCSSSWSCGCWRPTTRPPAGSRPRRSAGGTWSQPCPGRPDSRRSVPPTPGPDAHAVDGSPGPVDLAIITEPVQQPVMQGLPDPSLLPVAQPPPAGHAAATAQLTGREQPPGHPGTQDVDDAAQDRPVLDPGPAALGMRRLGGQQGSIAAQTSSGTSCSAMVGVVMAAHHPRSTITL